MVASHNDALVKVSAAVAGRDASSSPHGWVYGVLSVFGWLGISQVSDDLIFDGGTPDDALVKVSAAVAGRDASSSPHG